MLNFYRTFDASLSSICIGTSNPITDGVNHFLCFEPLHAKHSVDVNSQPSSGGACNALWEVQLAVNVLLIYTDIRCRHGSRISAIPAGHTRRDTFYLPELDVQRLVLEVVRYRNVMAEIGQPGVRNLQNSHPVKP